MTQIDLYGTLQAEQTLEAELLLSASTGATDNYELLKNRPSINGVVLSKDKSAEDLFLASADDLTAEKAARENADNELSQKIDNGIALTATVQGSSLTLTDAKNNCGLYSLNIKGNSTQDGTPTPENPADIVSVGDSGSLDITACGKNLYEGSQDFSGTWNRSNYWTTADETYNGLTVKKSSTRWNGLDKNIPVIAGKTCTFSCYAKCETDTVAGSILFTSNNYKNISLTTSWQRFEITVEPSRNMTANPRCEMNISGNTIYICGYQLEESSEITDYEAYKGNTATITSALPLCSVGDVADELIFNADGTAKVIKRTKTIVADGVNVKATFMSVSATNGRTQFRLKLDSSLYTDDKSYGECICSHLPFGKEVESTYTHILIDNDGGNVYPRCYAETSIVGATQDELNAWITSQNTAGTPFTVIAILATPEEINLTAAETQALLGLETFENLTNIINSDNAQMAVKYWRNEDLGSLFTAISRNTSQRLCALENAIIGG